MATVLAIPDPHHPWGNKKQLRDVVVAAANLQPDVILQLGDAYDFYCFSRFSKKMDFITPGKELALGRASFQEMWRALREAAPNARCIQLLGNHDLRIRLQVATKYPEIESLLDAMGMDEFFFQPEGVELHKPARDFLFIDGVGYHHGDWLRSQAVGARVKNALHSVVFGHTHRAWIQWLPLRQGDIFEMSCGNIGYTKALPFLYAPSDIPATTNGYGVITNGKPRFVPL